MAITEEVITKYLADVSDYNAKFAAMEARLSGVEAKAAAAGEQTKKAFQGAGTESDKLSKKLGEIGNRIAAAFTVTAIIAFGKASFQAFAEAELSAKKLQAAVGAQGGLQKDFNILLQQSKELQKISIFSDESIQGIQTLALQFGLTSEAVTELTPQIIDFASATGQDLNSALSSVLRGIEGNARGLKLYGVEVSTSGTRAERFTSIMEQLNQKFAGQGRIVADTAAGRLKQLSNAWNDLQETIGAAIAPLVAGAASLVKSFVGLTEVSLSDTLQKEQINLEATTLKLFDVNTKTEDRIKIINELKSVYPGYLGEVDADKVSNEALSVVLQKVNSDLINRIVLQKASEKAQEAAQKQQETAGDLAEQELKIRVKLIEISRINNVEINKSLPLLEQVRDITEQVRLKNANADFEDLQLLTAQAVTIQNKLNNVTKEATTLEAQRVQIAKDLGIELDKQDEKATTTGLEGETESERNKRIEKERKAIEDAEKEKADAFKKQQDANKQSAEKTLQIQLANLEKAKQEELGIEETSAAEKLLIDKKYLLERAKLFEDDPVEQAKIGAQIAEVNTKLNEQRIKDATETADAVSKQNEEAAQKDIKSAEDTAEKRKQLLRDVFDAAADLSSQLGSMLNAQDENEIARINTTKDAAVAAIDEQIESLEEANDRGKLSDKKLEEQKKKLLLERVAAEKRADDETKKIQRAEAEREKLLTIFRIGLILAEAIAELNAFKAIAAAAQLAIAIATPIPAFARGTKGKDKSGVGLVGERGAEFIYMPQGTQVVPADKTKKHKELLNSMIDNNLEQYLYKAYIAPALIEASKKMEDKRSKTFAENIASGFNKKTSVEWDTFFALQRNNKELAKMISDGMGKYYKNNSNDRYYH